MTTMTNKEIVAAYNLCAVALGEKEVNRFSDTKTGLKRLAAIQARMPAEKPAKRTASEGIAASWQNPEVAEKRLTRNAVLFNGVEHKSFRDAWAAAGFDDKQHIKHRMLLKAAGTLTVAGKTFTLGEQY